MSNPIYDSMLYYTKNRFYDKVLLPNENGCMEWQASKRDFGYGAFSLHGGFPIKAHRYSYELFNGKIPKGMHVLHKCDNPPCVAPEHLYLGTDKENSSDRIKRNRHSPPPVRFGEKNNKSKLTDNDVINILKLFNSGVSAYKVSKIYNMDKSTIQDIKSGKNWKHISRENK